jgi:succinate dehydrogenase / fumarate reductase membrane anchor subunit
MTTQRVVVGAHYGLLDWIAQRITAVVLAVYTVVLGLSLLLMPEFSQPAWKALFSGTFIRVLTLLAMLALCWHAWIGVRDIYMDYIKPTAIRLSLQVVTIVLLVGYVIWAINILWSI